MQHCGAQTGAEEDKILQYVVSLSVQSLIRSGNNYPTFYQNALLFYCHRAPTEFKLHDCQNSKITINHLSP